MWYIIFVRTNVTLYVRRFARTYVKSQNTCRTNVRLDVRVYYVSTNCQYVSEYLSGWVYHGILVSLYIIGIRLY